MSDVEGPRATGTRRPRPRVTSLAKSAPKTDPGPMLSLGAGSSLVSQPAEREMLLSMTASLG